MGKIAKLYRRNINGVITTLVFHILILLFLILTHINIKEEPAKEELVLDLSEIKIPEPAKEIKQPEKAIVEQQQKPSSTKLASNRAVNDAAKGFENASASSKDPFFDKAYKDEIAAAKKLVSDVNKNLARKIPEIGNIPMPADNAEGKTREEVKQSNFKGKSNIHYSLENRYHSYLPIPVYLAEGGGEIIVDIIVGRDGVVIKAEPRPNPAIADLTTFAYAKQAAEKTIFNEDPKAPERQKGTITYLFLAQ
jgi:hypothetical protein